MSHAPPPIEMQNAYAPVPPSRTSALAIVSLITGILGCLFVTPFVAIVTGILGVRATREPGVRGRGMAVAGIVLGLVWLLTGVAGGIAVGLFLKNSEPPAAVARQFTADVLAGNYDAALDNSSGLTEAYLRELRDTVAPWGANTDITLNTRRANAQRGGVTRWELSGTATFAAGGTKRVEYVVVTKPTGGYAVVDVDFK